MTVLGIALKSLRQRMLSTVLTSTCVALGIGLAVLVVTARGSGRRSFDDAARGYDAILGGTHTSRLATVLSTVFLVDQPTDVIPIGALDDVRRDPRVTYAVPYAVGDLFHGFRVVATTPELFDALADAGGAPLRGHVRGAVFGEGDAFEAVLGSFAAARTGLTIGSDLRGITHGMEEAGHAHDETWKVLGVLEPTGTPLDRAVFVTLGSWFHLKGHEKHDAAHDGEEAQAPWAVSSIVVRLKSPALRNVFAADMNKRPDLQASLPADEIRKLFGIVDQVDLLFRAVAWLVIAVSAISILVGLWNTIAGRRREIAILRALGARPAHVFFVVVLEAVVMCAIGGIAGLAIGHGALAAATPYLLEQFGVRITDSIGGADALLLLGTVAMGLVAGALPAWRAFRSPVARHLHPID